MLIGVLLMSPRLIEYDLFPFTLPLLLLLYRLIRPLAQARLITAALLAAWVGGNVLATRSHELWKWMECGVLVAVFTAGCWQLQRELQAAGAPAAEASTDKPRRLPA
jgi:hypothetical protein